MLTNFVYTVADVETEVVGNAIDPQQDKLKYIGFKNHIGRKVVFHYPTDKDKIQKTISFFKYIVGHNFKEYDKIVLEKHGFKFDHRQVIIDTLEISNNRLKQMLYLDIDDKSLGNLCDVFKLEHKKGDFDYDLLAKDKLEGKEYDWMVEYLHGDLDSCDDLFQHYYNMFIGFRDMVDAEDKERMKWLIAKSGSTAYKVICNQLGLKKEYNNDDEEGNTIMGAFVLQPKKRFCKGTISYRDAASLYPHVYMMGNLFSPVKKGEGWNGSGVYPNIYANELDGIRGTYSKTPGKMETFLKFMFDERSKIRKEMKGLDKNSQEYKNLDSKQLTYKILLNSCYGACNNPVFKNIYNETTASDCTAMARRTTKFAVTILEENKYEVLYADTDSCFVYDQYNDQSRLDTTFDYIREKQLESANVRIESHGFKVEDTIQCIWFFENDKGELNKKNYIYVDDRGGIHEKGIRVVRGDCSPIAKTVYEKYIKPLILKTEDFRLTVEQLSDWIKAEIILDPTKLKKRFRLKGYDYYKIQDGKEEATGLHAQLAKKYGMGTFYFVVNRRIGPGKLNHYCTLEELQEKYGTFWVDQIRIETYIGDLKCFLDETERKKIK